MPRHPSHASRLPASIATTALALIAVGITGCSSVSDGLSPSRVDYRAKAQPASKLDVPPDLTQLASDPRYQPPTGAAVSANALSSTQPPASVSSAAPIAASVLSGNRIERTGNQRWLVTALTPEQLWPLLRDYWQVNGFALTTDRQDIGLIETDWLENRTRLPQDFLARSISKVFDSVIDSGERDRYRMRVERTAAGTEVSISHRGAMQVVTGERGSEQVRWQPRASDAGLESEMLSRLLVQLSADTGSVTAATGTNAKTALTAATAVVAAAPATPARARQDATLGPATLQVDDGFDRAWRRVGVALDRGGFTVEDRDRSQGTYFVRYVDPKLAGKEEPNFIARLFGAKKEDLSGRRYRVKVAAQGNTASTVAVVDDSTSGRNEVAANTIAQLLLAELR